MRLKNWSSLAYLMNDKTIGCKTHTPKQSVIMIQKSYWSACELDAYKEHLLKGFDISIKIV